MIHKLFLVNKPVGKIFRKSPKKDNITDLRCIKLFFNYIILVEVGTFLNTAKRLQLFSIVILYLRPILFETVDDPWSSNSTSRINTILKLNQ